MLNFIFYINSPNFSDNLDKNIKLKFYIIMYRDSLNNKLNRGDIIVYGDQQTNTHLGYIIKF